ncbi:MAG: hypothetical protein K5829_01295 [Treponema sp.]|nr:hypothetical protein [Treponema sp.]
MAETEGQNYFTDEEISLFEDAFILGREPQSSNTRGQAYLHYKEVFSAFKNGRTVKWNWTNFLFGSFHLLYRKQYLWGFISLAATFLFVKFPPYLLIQALVFGLFGDFLLYQKFCSICDDCIKKGHKADSNLVCKVMKKKGGTNILISIIITIVAMVALVLLSLAVWGIGSLAGLITGWVSGLGA